MLAVQTRTKTRTIKKKNTLTESQEDASSRSLEGAKQTEDIPSVGGSLSSISFLLEPAPVVAILLLALFRASSVQAPSSWQVVLAHDHQKNIKMYLGVLYSFVGDEQFGRWGMNRRFPNRQETCRYLRRWSLFR